MSSSQRRGRNASYRQALCQIQEIDETGILPPTVPIDVEEFLQKIPQEEQVECMLSVLNMIIHKLNEINVAVNHDTEGISMKLVLTQKQADTSTKAIDQLRHENKTMRGIIQRQDDQLKDLNDKIAYLTAKSMEQNLTISNVTGDIGKKEDTTTTVLEFLHNTLEIDAGSEEVLVSHRMGKYSDQQTRPRTMIIRCTYPLKERIMANLKNLKDKRNSQDKPYYVNKQLPEQIIEQNRWIKQTIKAKKELEKTWDKDDRTKIQVINKKLYFDGELVKDKLPAPQPKDLFPDEAEKEKQEKIKLFCSDVDQQDGSSFQAYAIKTGNTYDVSRTYAKIRSLHPSATHIVAAANLKSGTMFQDDGEHGAGHKLLKHIEENFVNNSAVFVVRIYGGKHMGASRFKVYNSVAEQALDRANIKRVAKQQQSPKHPKSTPKKKT